MFGCKEDGGIWERKCYVKNDVGKFYGLILVVIIVFVFLVIVFFLKNKIKVFILY